MSERGSYGRRSARSRLSQCGSKGDTSAYDPQVGTAAAQEAATAQQAQNFDQNYETTVVEPALAAETAQANTTAAQQTQLFNIDEPVAAEQATEETQYGLPAATNYYNMVNNYSSADQQQIQAQAALGDMRTSEASNAGTLARQNQSLGISPNSGAATAERSDASIQNTAAEASAETQARYNAQQMGMNLTAGAASFANTGVANTVSATDAAGTSSNSATSALATDTASANNSASVQNTGYALANSAYGNNLDAYSRLGAADIASQSAGASGLGTALGSLGTLAMSLPGVSDRRLKKNIRQIGSLPSGLGIYSFDYIEGGRSQVGVMADEVEQVIPAAVITMANGYKAVFYSMLR